MNTITDTIQFFLFLMAELTVLFLGISTIVAFVLLYIPQTQLQAWFSRRGIGGNVLGATIGSLTPFCACSTIPMTVGLLNAGVSFGSVMSFIIASPLVNPIILGMIATMLGLKACLVYFAITFSGSILFGVILEKAGFAKQVKLIPSAQSCCNASDNKPLKSFRQKLAYAASKAYADFKPVLPYLVIGVALGAGIYGFVPQDFVVDIAGAQNPLAVPLAAIIGIPLYIRAETAIPIGLALAQKGMSVGAVIALIIGGAGMAIPEMSMLASIFRKKLVAAMVLTIFLTAVAGGLAFNALIKDPERTGHDTHIKQQTVNIK